MMWNRNRDSAKKSGQYFKKQNQNETKEMPNFHELYVERIRSKSINYKLQNFLPLKLPNYGLA